MKARKLFYAAADLTAVLLLIFFIVFPSEVNAPVRGALAFCAETLIPSLFVYMVLAKIVASLPASGALMSKIGCGPVVLAIGTLCGSPVGAAAAGALYSQGKISKKHAEYLCSFTNNVSASFMLGYVGATLFGDIAVGARLLGCQFAANLVTASVMKYVTFGKNPVPKPLSAEVNRTGLREAITGGAEAMINVCACAVFFIVLSSAAASVFPLGKIGIALLRSTLEFSSGCACAGELAGKAKFVVCAYACGQTGISVMLQVRSITAGKLSIRPYAVGKLINCAVMTALSYAIG